MHSEKLKEFQTWVKSLINKTLQKYCSVQALVLTCKDSLLFLSLFSLDCEAADTCPALPAPSPRHLYELRILYLSFNSHSNLPKANNF